MKLYLHSLKLHLKSLLQYKTSTILSFLSQFLVFFSYYFIIIALFSKFDNIKGFTLYEVLFTFAVIEFGYSIICAFARGVDHFDELILSGSFDQLLLKPVPIIVQVLAYKFDLVKISRVIQSIIILFIAIGNLQISWTIYKVITLILMLMASIGVFFGIFLLAAAYCFVTVQGLEVRNLFTYGGKHIAQYPIGVFKKGIVFIFSFIIPYSFINYYPLLFVLGKSNNYLYMLSPFIAFIYLIPCFIIFNNGIKKYSSVGS